MRLALLCLLSMLVACGPQVDTPLQTTSAASHGEADMKPAVGPRFSVTRVGVFTDGLAYESKRGIYTIVDRQTGREYVGISGVGIAETGLHSEGKTSEEDER